MMIANLNNWKSIKESNPISSNVFCADPTAVEYEGRLYVYGTNDHEQYLNAEKNTYEKIKSLVCFSTVDMVNWTFHGEINVGKIAPWIYNSWAPSICKRNEEDGKTHFYLYFSNSGCGVGVITSTSPTGPWTDPLGHPLINYGMEDLNSPNPFDPGVCIDEKGTGWLTFGGGIVEGKDSSMPGSSKIVKLGKDMISLDSDFVDIKAPYFYEASELNIVNGTFIYTYNTNWEERTKWQEKALPATRCSMCYMTTKTPLDSDSWKYQDNYFKNPGDMGFSDSNNHTHFEKYKNDWYLFYHTLGLEEKSPVKGGFRSLCVDKLNVDESNGKITIAQATRNGVDALQNLNPFDVVDGTTIYTSSDLWYENLDTPADICSRANKPGAWFMVKNVDFGDGAEEISVCGKGTGLLEIRLDGVEEKAAVVLRLGSEKDFSEVNACFVATVKGVHDVYFVFDSEGSCIKNWKAK